MSIRVMSHVWQMPMPPAEKLVLLALADAANDEGHCWPSISTIATKSGLSERSVQRAIRAFEKAGHLTRNEVLGKGCKYHLHPRQSVNPDTVSPVTNETQTPDTVSPNPLEPSLPQKVKPSSVKRAMRIPENFLPILSGKSASTVDGWPPGMLESEIEQFRDHHTAKGTTSLDWQASFRTWVRNAEKWRKPQHGNRAYQDKPSAWAPAPVMGYGRN